MPPILLDTSGNPLPYKVYMDTLGSYYRSQAQRNPGDSYIPSPSQALLFLLQGAEEAADMDSVPYQLAWDVVGHSPGHQLTDLTNPATSSTVDPQLALL